MQRYLTVLTFSFFSIFQTNRKIMEIAWKFWFFAQVIRHIFFDKYLKIAPSQTGVLTHCVFLVSHLIFLRSLNWMLQNPQLLPVFVWRKLQKKRTTIIIKSLTWIKWSVSGFNGYNWIKKIVLKHKSYLDN